MRALIFAILGAALFVFSANAQTKGPLDEPGDRSLFTVHATGVQVYECRAGSNGALAWAFKEPRADLTLNGQPFGRHYAGPTWEQRDGSRITGKVVKNEPAPASDDIPWLRLSVASHAGSGALDPVTAIQRIDTKGGVLSGACETAGSLKEEPYTATYVLLGR